MKMLIAGLTAGLFAVTLAACERESVTHTKTTTDDRGNVVSQEKSKTTVDSEGNVQKTETKTDNR